MCYTLLQNKRLYLEAPPPPPPPQVNFEAVGQTKKKLKVQMKCFFIAEFERAAKIRKIAVYRFLISPLVPEL